MSLSSQDRSVNEKKVKLKHAVVILCVVVGEDIVHSNGAIIDGYYILCIASAIKNSTSIYAQVSNINNKNDTVVVKCSIFAIDESSNIALLKFQSDEITNRHPYFVFGGSKNLYNKEKVYLLGYNGRSTPIINGYYSYEVISNHHCDPNGFMCGDFVLLDGAKIEGNGMALVNDKFDLVGIQFRHHTNIVLSSYYISRIIAKILDMKPDGIIRYIRPVIGIKARLLLMQDIIKYKYNIVMGYIVTEDFDILLKGDIISKIELIDNDRKKGKVYNLGAGFCQQPISATLCGQDIGNKVRLFYLKISEEYSETYSVEYTLVEPIECDTHITI